MTTRRREVSPGINWLVLNGPVRTQTCSFLRCKSRMLTVVFCHCSCTEGYDGRALVNRSPSLYAASTHKNDLDELKRDYARAIAEEDYSLASVYAGVGAGLIRKEENAEDVVSKVQQEMESRLTGSFELQPPSSLPSSWYPLS